MAINKRSLRPLTAEAGRHIASSSVLAQTTARLSLGAAALFVTLLAVLHVLKPEYDPSWRMISEYAIGRYGWVMTAAFIALAISYASLAATLHIQLQSVSGRIGSALLLLGALATLISAIFTTDPITISPDAVTTSGRLHGLGFVSVATFPIAATLISWTLTRHHRWFMARGTLLVVVSFVWVGVLVFIVSLASMFQGTFGPEVVIGWQNRLLVSTYVLWVMVIAWHSTHVNAAAHW